MHNLNNVVIAFPKAEIAQNIKKILASSGYSVAAVCSSGAQALSSIERLSTGILVCGYKFVDMMYTELYEYMPSDFQMLLIASQDILMERDVDNLVSLSTPLRVHELLQTMEMMDYTIARRRKKMRKQPKQRTEEEKEIINNAKALIMVRNGMTEEEAHKYIQKRSMDNGVDIVETAQMILSLLENV